MNPGVCQSRADRTLSGEKKGGFCLLPSNGLARKGGTKLKDIPLYVLRDGRAGKSSRDGGIYEKGSPR